jgi:hypothetical protein
METPGDEAQIEYRSLRGERHRIPANSIDMVATRVEDRTGSLYTSLGELIRVLDVVQVLRQWRFRLMIVVARDAGDHLGYLKRAFAKVAWVEVIQDRRGGRDRRGPQARPDSAERRGRPDVDARLRQAPWAVVRLDGPGA